MSIRTETINYDTDLNEYKITADIEESYDKNSGADIDGNRGVGKWFIDSIKITEVYCHNTDYLMAVDRIPDRLINKLCRGFY